jgi:hypothetical protein
MLAAGMANERCAGPVFFGADGEAEGDDGGGFGAAGRARRRAWQRVKYWRRRAADEERQRAGGLATWPCLPANTCVHVTVEWMEDLRCQQADPAVTALLLPLPHLAPAAEAEARAAAEARRGSPPEPSRGFRVPADCVPELLMVWEFTQVGGWVGVVRWTGGMLSGWTGNAAVGWVAGWQGELPGGPEAAAAWLLWDTSERYTCTCRCRTAV